MTFLDKVFGWEQISDVKPVLTRCQLSLAMAAALIFGATTTANCQTEENIPHIKMNDVHITTAIENFARMANLNYMVDPKLFAPPGGSNPNGIPEPSLSIDWTNMTAKDALAMVLKAFGRVMVQDKFTTVAFITSTNHIKKPVDVSLLAGTNAAALVAMIYFADVPLDAALGNIIQRGALPVTLDAKVSDYVDPADSTINKFHNAPPVSLRWQNLTPVQAMVALCEAYNLVIVKDATTGVVSIKPRE